MFFVYVLINQENKQTYVGQTDDLQRRLDRHNHVIPNYTGSYTSRFEHSWKYLYVEGCSTREAAMIQEKWFKTGVGRDSIREIIKLIAS